VRWRSGCTLRLGLSRDAAVPADGGRGGGAARVPLVELFRTSPRPTVLLTFIQTGPNIA